MATRALSGRHPLAKLGRKDRALHYQPAETYPSKANDPATIAMSRGRGSSVKIDIQGGSEVDAGSELEGAATRAGVVRLHGLRGLTEQGVGNVAALLGAL